MAVNKSVTPWSSRHPSPVLTATGDYIPFSTTLYQWNHIAWLFRDSSLLYGLVVHSFLILDGIKALVLGGYTAICLFVHLLMDV